MSITAHSITSTDEELREALLSANIPTLLMVLAHVTGDHSWLEPPYIPTRTIALNDNDTAGFSDELQAAVREGALEMIRDWRDGRIPDPPAPTSRQITEMLSISMGEVVPEEFGAMMAEEARFTRRDFEWSASPPADKLADFRVIIIGAGISGILAAIKLRDLRIPYVVLEKNAAVGGTWLENSYPGAGVDTPSHIYEFSFETSPTWSRYYAKQEEILAYLSDVAARHEIIESIQFETEVISAGYDPRQQRWHVVARDKNEEVRSYAANALISAVGQLNRPKIPDIPGLESFSGPMFHSAMWQNDVELEGKRVGIIGTGATSMQIVTALAGTPSELLVFQRSPQWAAPNGNYKRDISPGTRLLMEQLPYYARWYRIRLLWIFNDKLHPSLMIDPEWPHPERSINAANDRHRSYFTQHILRELGDRADLLPKVLPTYPPYGKRILMDNGWYEAVTRPDVELVSHEVVAVDGDDVVTADGERHKVDVLILATGFLNQRMLYPMEIRGASGQSLRELWGENDAKAYLGMTVPGYPNFFIMLGPNTALGHGGSVIFMSECQVNYITRVLGRMIEDGISAVEVKQGVYDRYNETVDSAHGRMIWSHPGMTNWYRNPRGRVVAVTPFRLLDYWNMTHRPDLADYSATFRTPRNA